VTLSQRGAFPAEYEAGIVDAPPAGVADFTLNAGPDSTRVVTIKVLPQHDTMPWVANVAVPEPTRATTISGIFSTPCLTTLCLIEGGTAVLIDVRRPDAHQIVPTDGPVLVVREALEDSLLLLVTPWAITAVGAGEVRWTSRRIAIEEIRVDSIKSGWLRGMADPDDEAHDFAVELSTGQLVGGAEA
jgi:hypothetical protein